MAISIISNFTSGKYYPTSNPINVTIDSNNSGKCNFRYICDIYINNIKVFSDKLFPDPTTGYGFFQISRVLQDYTKTYLPTNTSLIFNTAVDASAPTSLFQVACKFGEEYDNSTNCDGTVLQYQNLITSATFSAYQGVFDYEDFPSYTYTNYIVGTASANTTTKFLTNSPREVEITYNDTYYLDFLSNATPGTTNWSLAVNINYYGGSTSSLSIPSTNLSARKRFRLYVGPYDINKYYTIPVINQSVSSYSVYLKYGSNIISETFTFKVKDPKTFQTRIGFVGALGGIEHFTFFHRNNKRIEVERKTYEKTLQANSSGAWKYSVGDRGTTTYKVNATEKHLVSTYCDRTSSDWLYEMWLSPEVFTYKRPELKTTRIYDELGTYDGSQPSSTKILLWVNDVDGLSAGDYIMVLPEYVDGYVEFIGRFQIQSIVGNIVDIGATYGSYFPPKELCAFIYKDTTFERLPIIISDNSIEVKQKLSKPIEYALNYTMAYSKNTLRG